MGGLRSHDISSDIGFSAKYVCWGRGKKRCFEEMELEVWLERDGRRTFLKGGSF